MSAADNKALLRSLAQRCARCRLRSVRVEPQGGAPGKFVCRDYMACLARWRANNTNELARQYELLREQNLKDGLREYHLRGGGNDDAPA